MSRNGPVLLLAGIATSAVIVLAVVLARPAPVAAPSPTPSATVAASATATRTPTETATTTASPAPTVAASPSPAVGGRYVSALLGYSLELPLPWHRSICSGTVTQQTPTPMGEAFYGVEPREFTASDVGTAHPEIQVLAEDNPQGLSPRQWAESGRSSGTSVDQRIDDATFAGRPAARRSVPDSPPTYFVQNGGRMYVVGVHQSGAGRWDAVTQQTMVQIIGSFRFITPAEQASARAALPTAPPPRTPEQVADGVAGAFAAKNAGALAEFAAPCMATFGEQAGGTSVSREKYMDDLRAAFAAGLVVTVRPRPFEGDRTAQFPNLTIQSTWQEPRRTVERKLMLRRGLNDRWEWHGTLERFQ